MDLFIPAVVTAIGCALLGVYAIWWNPRSRSNLYFALLSWTIGTWAAVFYWSLVAFSMILVRSCMVLAVVWTYLFFLFAATTTQRQKSHPVLLHGTTILLIILSLSPWVFSGSDIINGQEMPVTDWGIYVFNVYIFTLTSIALYLFIKAYTAVTGVQKHQLRIIIVSWSISTFLTIGSMFLAVVILQTRAFFPLGYLAQLIFVSSTTYAMTRHRFLNVRAFIHKAILYHGVMLSIGALYAIGVFMVYHYGQRWLPAWSILASAALVWMSLYTPLRHALQTFLDGHFFHNHIYVGKRYSSPQVTAQATTTTIQSFTAELAEELSRTVALPVESISVLQQQFHRVQQFYPEHTHRHVLLNSPVIEEYRELQTTEPTLYVLPDAPYHIQRFMKRYNAYATLAIFHHTLPLIIVLFGTQHEQRPGSQSTTPDLMQIIQRVHTTLPTMLRWQGTIAGLHQSYQSGKFYSVRPQ